MRIPVKLGAQESVPLESLCINSPHCLKETGDRVLKGLFNHWGGKSCQAGSHVGMLTLDTSTATTNIYLPPGCPSPPGSHVSLWRGVTEDMLG